MKILNFLIFFLQRCFRVRVVRDTNNYAFISLSRICLKGPKHIYTWKCGLDPWKYHSHYWPLCRSSKAEHYSVVTQQVIVCWLCYTLGEIFCYKKEDQSWKIRAGWSLVASETYCCTGDVYSDKADGNISRNICCPSFFCTATQMLLTTCM